MQQTVLIKKIEDERVYTNRYGDNGTVQNVIIQWVDKQPNREGNMVDVNQFVKATMFNSDVEAFRNANFKVGDWMTCHLRFDIKGQYDNNEITIIAPKHFQ